MKITFLCGTFEPGRDGVGDYVAMFARSLARQGHLCQVIALADRFAAVATNGRDAAADCEVVRLPACGWPHGNTRAAETALGRFAPDCVSLQMVCYAYEPRGLLLHSARSLLRLRGGGKCHLMFHELWIGEAAGSGLKERIVGALQKRLLLRTTRLWAPAVINTSNPVYRELLRRNGVAAQELPLPGTIPIVPESHSNARQWLLARLGTAGVGNNAMLAGVFGAIHPGWQAANWLELLRRGCVHGGRGLVLIQLGRAGERGLQIWRELQSQFGTGIAFVELGPLPAEDISRALQGLDLGIATSPGQLAGKSSTIAAMLEHGTPVAVTSRDYRLRAGATPEPTPHALLHPLDDGFVTRLLAGQIPRAAPQPRSDIYLTFLKSLQEAEDAENSTRSAAPPGAAGAKVTIL
ncbi:MAG TPA: glycosyltransferase [Steroidobacteraceae bacterium]|nr:glycosyltransferase [Steroidobacteraceae bacterium]